jgi:hypothetical protein
MVVGSARTSPSKSAARISTIRAAESLRGLDHDVAAAPTLLEVFPQLTEHQLVEILRQLATTRGLAATTRSGNTSQLRRHLAGQ